MCQGEVLCHTYKKHVKEPLSVVNIISNCQPYHQPIRQPYLRTYNLLGTYPICILSFIFLSIMSMIKHLGYNHNYIFNKGLENPSFLKKKLLVLDKKGKMDSHFHGNYKKKRGNDTREEKIYFDKFILKYFQ